jgi:hypothetical protein
MSESEASLEVKQVLPEINKIVMRIHRDLLWIRWMLARASLSLMAGIVVFLLKHK